MGDPLMTLEKSEGPEETIPVKPVAIAPAGVTVPSAVGERLSGALV